MRKREEQTYFSALIAQQSRSRKEWITSEIVKPINLDLLMLTINGSRHRKQHDRPYWCVNCKRSFALSADLRRHRPQHLRKTDRHRFKCSILSCGFKGTTRKNTLKKHLKEVHGLTDMTNSRNFVPEEDHHKQRLDFLEAIGLAELDKVKQMASRLMLARYEFDRTALHLASVQGHEEVINILLAHSCNINALDDDKRTALHFAAGGGHRSTVKLLLEKGMTLSLTLFRQMLIKQERMWKL